MWLEWDESDKSERRGKGRGCYSILDFFSSMDYFENASFLNNYLDILLVEIVLRNCLMKRIDDRRD